MLNSNTRSFIVPLVIILISLFFLVRYKLSYSSPFPSRPVNVSFAASFKSFTHGVPIQSTTNGQLFPFPDESPLVRMYLDVVQDTVCGLTLRTQERSVTYPIDVKKYSLNVEQRIVGGDWPSIGITMIGQKRLMNIEWSIRFAIANNIPGDFIECGVWRGGASIFARAVLKAFGIMHRHVWVVDSFQGLPKARTKNDDDGWSKQEYLKVPLEEVQTNFRAFDLLDDQVHFCKGYFIDSLPRCNVSQIAVLRMDGDMYESTMDQFFNLYAKIAVGGVIIVDDYSIDPCLRAVNDFRSWHGITDEIKEIPGTPIGRYWIKKTKVELQMHRYKPLLVQQ